MFDTSTLLVVCGAIIVALAWWWSRTGLAALSAQATANTCASCLYDLTGLPPGLQCPECASPLRLSEFRDPIVPHWVVSASMLGSVVANIPAAAFLIAHDLFNLNLTLMAVLWSVVIHICCILVAQRPKKTAAKLAITVTLGVQFLTQAICVAEALLHPPANGRVLWALDPEAILLTAILSSAAAFALTSIIAIVIISTRLTDDKPIDAIG